jgi:chromosome segregation ATPase
MEESRPPRRAQDQEVSMGIIKGVIRYGVIGTLASGAVVLVAGPQRTMALLNQVTGSVHRLIDGQIEDPVVLRQQLRELENQYPEKIAAVRGDLAELQQQKTAMQSELVTSQRVVEMTEDDLSGMHDLLAKAEGAKTTAEGPFLVKVRFDGRSLDLDQAYAKANEIAQVRDAYATKAGDTQNALNYLDQQEQRLTELLTKLETERAEFQAQLWSLDQQVDTVARNDRLIDIMENRQETIDEHSRYAVASLDQLKTRFAEIRSKQEARLDALSVPATTRTYEDRAKQSLDSESGRRQIGRLFDAPKTIEVAPTVIEITPDAPEEAEDSGNLVYRGR